MGFPVVDEAFVAFVETLQRNHFLDVTGILDLATLTAWRGEEPDSPPPEKKGQMATSAMGLRGKILVSTGEACALPPEVDHLVVPAAAVGAWKRAGASCPIWPAHVMSLEPISGQILTLRHTKARWLLVTKAIWKAWGAKIVGLMEELSLELSSSGLSWVVFEGHRPRLVAADQKPAIRLARRFTGVFPTLAPLQEPDLAARQAMAEWFRFGGVGWGRACPGLRLGPGTNPRRLEVYREWLKNRGAPLELAWDQGDSGRIAGAYLKGEPSPVEFVENAQVFPSRPTPTPRRKRKSGPKGPHKKATRIRRMALRMEKKSREGLDGKRGDF